jgi:hypothetical protein
MGKNPSTLKRLGCTLLNFVKKTFCFPESKTLLINKHFFAGQNPPTSVPMSVSNDPFGITRSIFASTPNHINRSQDYLLQVNKSSITNTNKCDHWDRETDDINYIISYTYTCLVLNKTDPINRTIPLTVIT